MVSIMVVIMYGWVLLPLLTAGDAPRPCVFPLIYKRKSYSSCTKDGSEHGKLWCATTANYDKTPQWKHCALSEYGGNSGGQACVFPYVYKGRTYYTCTNEDAETGNFWCATMGSHDRDAKWSYCADTSRILVVTH
ncbi:PREDICTED: epididymal sperm-binding protein 1-like [Gekko japonicus]|uniref:Epididymal sperm-binding protein 1-like n=1 Tax=Gekko japonicus TaxID=146911 RepID=A0ABM1KWX4_GEKJA|nr:PREDICTED: epididymal sperm-binding protein 1-like [Gekko japonicus]